MTRDEIIGATRELIGAGGSFVLATVDQEGCPQLRWMGAALLEEPLTLYIAAGANSRKMDQIRGNKRSQLMFQNSEYSRVATLCGDCDVVQEAEIKRRVWDGMPGVSQFFSGADDANFGVIRFVTRRVELLDTKQGHTPMVADL